MVIKNLTPHTLNLKGSSYKSEGIVRVSSTETKIGELPDGTELVKTVFGEVEGLPEQKEGVVLVVSGLVRSRLPNRTDLASPAKLQRDEQGRVIGANALSLN